MAMSLQQSKSRIRSITATQKITNAMELVSTSKLKRAKELNMKISPFKNEVIDIVSAVAANIAEDESIFLKTSKIGKKLYIIITSSLGLCGGYNNNIFKYCHDKIKMQDDLIVIGSKGIYYYKNRHYNLIDKYEEMPTLDLKENISTLITNRILKDYKNQIYNCVEIIYTQFINSLTFQPIRFQLLPLDKSNLKNKFKKELLLEPTPIDVLNHLLPFYLTSTIKGFIVESMLSEQASRRTAMESATDNATELKDKLMLEYNKARQAAITQEITEISGSAEALNK